MEGSAVLDSSVMIKWFRQEEVLAKEALSLRSDYLAGQLLVFVPYLAAYELANVLRYKRDLSTEQVQEAIQSLYDMGFEWSAPSNSLMERTIEIARLYDTSIYDASFVTLAESLGIILVTADERLVGRLSALSFVRFLGAL